MVSWIRDRFNLILLCAYYAQAILASDLVRVLPSVQLWPEEQFPLMEFGRMVLDENVKNYYSEVESIAFDPGVTVPGKLIPPHLQSPLDISRPHLTLCSHVFFIQGCVVRIAVCYPSTTYILGWR